TKTSILNQIHGISLDIYLNFVSCYLDASLSYNQMLLCHYSLGPGTLVHYRFCNLLPKMLA
ncbi:hypothetical protein ACJBS5_11045, partial [Streptococcus suis]